MKKLVVLLMTFILSVSAFAVDVDTLVKGSKYTPFIMMQTDCDDEDVVTVTQIMLNNMHKNMIDYMSIDELFGKAAIKSWPETETANFIEHFLYYLYVSGKTENLEYVNGKVRVLDYNVINAYAETVQEGNILIKTVLSNINDEEASNIVLQALIDTAALVMGE